MESNVWPSTRIEIPGSEVCLGGHHADLLRPQWGDLPMEELDWLVQLYDQPAGVIAHGHLLQITSSA